MVSTKIIFRTDKKNSLGEHPLYLRIIKNRKSKYLSLGQYIKADFWDDEKKRVKKSHPNSQRLNNFIAQKIADAEGVALEMQTTDKYTTPQQVKDQILGRTSESFFKFADRYILDKAQVDTYSTVIRIKTVYGKVKTYMQGRDLLIDEITVNWLKNYESYLRNDKGNRINTIMANLKIIRSILNEAVREELLQYEKNPFRRFSIKSENVQKCFLTEDELAKFEQLQLQKDTMPALTRDLYVFAAYSAGLRISDLLQLQWKDFDGEKLLVQTQKTDSLVSIKLPLKALEIISRYKTDDASESAFIFPVLDANISSYNTKDFYDAQQSAYQRVNKNLKKVTALAGIEKNIHFHTSRHTWATRALSKGMRIEYVSKLMGHATIKTTQIYAKIVNAELDQAMEVFN